jgi:hypothetical protein
MDMTLIGKQEKYIEQLGEQTVEAHELPDFIRKSFGMKGKLISGMSEDAIKDGIHTAELIYHPMWIVRNTVVATRRPFKPKRIPNIIFVDAVSGYRGLFSTVPFISETAVEKDKIINHIIDAQAVGRYIKDVQTSQIDRSYVLKKPNHEPSEPRLVHLPLWKIEMQGRSGRETHYINANTGASENFMSSRWASGADLMKH